MYHIYLCVYVNTDPVYAVLCNNVVCPAEPHGALASNNCEVKQPPTWEGSMGARRGASEAVIVSGG